MKHFTTDYNSFFYRKQELKDNMSKEAGKKRKIISVNEKNKIINDFEHGLNIASLAKKYNYSYATIANICKRDSQKIKDTATKNITGIDASTKIRPVIMTKMESLLYIWIEDCNQKGLPLGMQNIILKSIDIYGSLKLKLDPNNKHTFNASRGWFDKFKKRYKLHSLILNGESASADTSQADNFVRNFSKDVEGKYTLDQIINVDETGLFWKRMPKRTFISQDAKSVQGHKVSKERLTLLLGCNASGSLKLKPLLIYTSENPRAFKNVDKSKLGVYWRSNKKAWMTASMFIDWVKSCLIKELNHFSKHNEVPFKFLVLLDNAPGHSNLEVLNSLCDGLTFMFLPPNTTSLIQPMDQGCISTFKSYYLKKSYQAILNSDLDEALVKDLWKKFSILDGVKHIVSAWSDVTEKCLKGSWKKLFPTVIYECENELDMNLNEIQVDALNCGISGMERDDLMEVIQETLEFSVDDLIQIHEQNQSDSLTESEEETEQLKKINKKDIMEILELFQKLKLKIKESDTDRERSAMVEKQLNEIEKYYSN